MPFKFADPKSDIAFKKVFGNENKRGILICFLNAVLGLENENAIESITILNPYQALKISGLKETNLDVRAKTCSGVSFIVEMQVEPQDFFGKRALYYTSKAYVGQIEKAVDYPKLNQVIFIGILDFSLFEGKDCLTRHLILNKSTLKQEIKDFELNFIELPKFHKNEHELENIVDKWIYFFIHAEDLKVVPETLSESQEISEAFEILEQHNWTQEELDVYDYWQMKDAGHRDAINTAHRQGHRQGIEQGKKQNSINIAKAMLKDGTSIEMVMKYTGLNSEEIKLCR